MYALLLTLGCHPIEAIAPGNGTIIPTHGDAMVHSDGPQIVDADDAPLQLRCVNIDGWLQPIPYLISDSGHALLTSPTEFAGRLDEVVGAERAGEFWQEYRDAFLTESDIERIAQLGFNCARLPLYHRFADEDALTRVDQALDWGLAHNVYIVLDLHSVPGGQNAVSTVSDVPRDEAVAGLWEGDAVDQNQADTIALWEMLATRYADHVALAGYDLLNEPALPQGVDGGALPALYSEIIAAVRELDSQHMFFIEGDALAHDFSAFDAPLDDNMAYEFHAYALTGFEDWADPDAGDLEDYIALRDTHDRPLWLGEFGEERIDWQVEMIALMEDHEIGWALYPWKRKQTWWFNPVLQQIAPVTDWYDLADYLAQPSDGTIPTPSAADAERGMAQLLEAVRLENCGEDAELANAVLVD